jgi:hypothetical protein
MAMTIEQQRTLAIASARLRMQEKKPEEPSALSQIGEGAMKYLVRPANELAGAVVEPAAQMAIGFIAKPVSEIAGLAATGYEAATGGETAQNIPGFKQQIAESLTYQPRTQLGQAVSENILAPIGGAIESGAEAVTKPLSMGNEIAAAGLKEAALQGIGFVGVKGAPKVGEKIKSANQIKLDAIKEQKRIDSEINRIRDDGKSLGLVAPAETSTKRALSNLGQANKFLSLKNRKVATNALADEVGLKKGAISDTDISNRIGELSSSYGDVEKALGKGVPIKLDFKRDVYNMLNPMKEKFAQDPQAFASLSAPIKLLEQQVAPITDATGKMVKQEISPSIVMAKIKQLRNDAREYAKNPTGDPVKTEMASTSYELANLYENLMENVLTKSGKTALLEKFRDSRKKLAQIHVLESARMDDGLIDPVRLSSVIGKYKADQKYATGKIKTVAEFANTFKDVMNPIREKDLPTGSRWEFVGAIGAVPAAAATGNLGYLTMAAPMAARAIAPTLAERGLLQGSAPSYQLGAGRRLSGMLAEPTLRATPFIANQPEEQQ